MTIQHSTSHLPSSYQSSGVNACLAGQEVGQNVQNVMTLWLTRILRFSVDVIFSFFIRLR